MSMRTHEIKNYTTPVEALAIQDVTGASVGEIIDTRGTCGTLFVLTSATLATGSWAVTIDEGNDSGLSDASAVASKDLVGTLADMAFADTDDNASKSIAYIGDKRYVRLTLTATGASGTNNFSGVAIQTNGANEPGA